MSNLGKICLVTLTAIVLIQLSCSNIISQEEEPGNQENDRIMITNDETELEYRVQYFNDQDVTIDPGGSGLMAKRAEFQAFSLSLVAEVLPPSIDGQVLNTFPYKPVREQLIIEITDSPKITILGAGVLYYDAQN